MSAKNAPLVASRHPECRALIPLSAVNKGIRAPESEPLDATKGAPSAKKSFRRKDHFLPVLSLSNGYFLVPSPSGRGAFASRRPKMSGYWQGAVYIVHGLRSVRVNIWLACSSFSKRFSDGNHFSLRPIRKAISVTFPSVVAACPSSTGETGS